MRTLVLVALLGLVLSVLAAPPNDPPNPECDPAHDKNLKSDNPGKMAEAIKRCLATKLSTPAAGALARFALAQHNGEDRVHRWGGAHNLFSNGPAGKWHKWNDDKANFFTYNTGFTRGRETYTALIYFVTVEKTPPTIKTADLTHKLQALNTDAMSLFSHIAGEGLMGLKRAKAADPHKADRGQAYHLAAFQTVYPEITQALAWLITQNYNPNFPSPLPENAPFKSGDAHYWSGFRDGWAVAHGGTAATTRKYSTTMGMGMYYVFDAAETSGGVHGTLALNCPFGDDMKVLDVTMDTPHTQQTRKDLVHAGILHDGEPANDLILGVNNYNQWNWPSLVEVVLQQMKVMVVFRGGNVHPKTSPYFCDKGALDYAHCTTPPLPPRFRQRFSEAKKRTKAAALNPA